MKYYTVYKVTNLINGKYYIGKHKTNDPNDQYMGSGKLIKSAVAKYGIENFIKEILYVFDNEKQMNLTERILVVPDNETNYNLLPGGQGGFEYILNNGYHYNSKGKKRSDKTREKMRKNHWSRGSKRETTLKKCKESMKYTPLTKERKLKQSATMKLKFMNPEFVKQHSECNSKKIVIDGIEFDSGKKAALHYKVTPQAVFYRLKSDNHPNWNYKKETI